MPQPFLTDLISAQAQCFLQCFSAVIGVVQLFPASHNPGRGPQADSSGVSGDRPGAQGAAEQAAHQAPLFPPAGCRPSGPAWSSLSAQHLDVSPHGIPPPPTQHLLTDVAGVGLQDRTL